MDVGDRIKLRRKQKGMTQEELAEEAKLSLPAIWQFERNASKPNFTSLVKLATSLAVSVDYLVFGEERIERSKELELTLKDLKETLARVETHEISLKPAAENDKQKGTVPFAGKLPNVELPVSKNADRIEFPTKWLPDKKGFVVEVNGNELWDEGIISGCLLAVAPSQRANLKPGDIALVDVNREKYVARISFLDGKPVAELEGLRGQLISSEEFEVKGVVTWIGRKTRNDSFNPAL